ncbi:MAG TPA: primosomal protein N' [Bryobacteraceae bacterium]|nr:primosomal protein N' [Bryobacteraceae bacterium]
MPRYADVALPVPLDQPFTYELSSALQDRVQAGCRVIVPFGARKLTGIVVRTHDDPPQQSLREASRLLDEEPALEPHLIALGRWMASYYCAPLGEALRVMAPLAGEVHTSRVWTLTEAGHQAARQLTFAAETDDPTLTLLRMLSARSLSARYLGKKVSDAPRMLRALQKKGLAVVEDVREGRDPLRASSERLRVTAAVTRPEAKLSKSEREVLSFLELHPGSHNLRELEAQVKSASQAARSLARRSLVRLEAESAAAPAWTVRPRPELNQWQQAAFDEIRSAVESQTFSAFLLQGVTGSGKTEVYLRSIEAALASGRNALLLVPEIALTPAVAGQFYARFGEGVAILHSAFHDVERAEQWRRIRSGAATVVVGTRSGVFAPVQNLGLLIVDEEHDGSYKQQDTPRYNGRDVAVMRAMQAGACVLLGSATPSLESRYNVERGKYRLLQLPHRVEQRPLPQVELIDMREEFQETRKQTTFSRATTEAIQARLDAGEQIIVLHNRRGFSTFVACRSCGERVECVNCSVALTYHRRDKRMLCHYCGYADRVPERCPRCTSEYIYFLGTGSEKVEDELHSTFPQARIARLDRDTAGGKRHFENILAAFRDGSYDILAGTQMIAKGHDIPNVTLVAVVNADIGLGMPDFRAAERTFQLLTQVAGRAGRGQLPGRVLIQTINPEHYAIQHAAAQDFNGFYAREIEFRRAMRYPPFAALANILVRSEKKEDAMRMAGELSLLLTPPPERTRVLGPAEAPVPRLKNEFRYQLLIKAASRKTLNETLNKLRAWSLDHNWSPVALLVDVDPLSLL